MIFFLKKIKIPTNLEIFQTSQKSEFDIKFDSFQNILNII